MNKLKLYTVNPFLTIMCSRARFRKFVFDHRQKLIDANNPAYAAIIAALTLLYESLFGRIEDYDVTLNDQVALTKRVIKIMHDCGRSAAKLEASVLVHYDKTDDVYKEFYPHGLTEYDNMNETTAEVLMDRLIEKTHTYSGDVGITWEPIFQDYRDKYDLAFAGQRGKMGNLDQTVDMYNAEFTPICIQLFKDMLTIMLQDPSHPEKLLGFFDETIVNFESHIHKLTIHAQSKAASDIHFDEEDTIQITSKFDHDLPYYFAVDIDSEPGTEIFKLIAHTKVKVKGPTTGAPDMKVIVFINDTDFDAKVEVLLK